MSVDEILFALVCEGTSDDALLPHLEALCLDSGANAATGIYVDLSRSPSPPGHSVQQRLLGALEETSSTVDLVFVHRDGDSRDATSRRSEVVQAAERAVECGLIPHPALVVPVVPIQATEAWALLDEAAVRDVAGKPKGREALGIPAPRNLERTADPKACLKEALRIASELTGRKADRFARRFSVHRRALLLRMDTAAASTHLAAWQALQRDTQTAVRAIP